MAPEYIGYNPTAKGTSKDPLAEFDSAGEFENLNVSKGSFGGLGGAAEADADRALGEFAKLGGTDKISSIKAHGSASIPKGGGPDSNVSK